MAEKTGVTPGYLHGFSRTEQDRLYWQARLLAPSIYSKVDFSGVHRLIEVGSGVGAQSEILLERYPHLKIEGIDASTDQVKRAQEHLAAQIRAGRARFQVGDALKLPFSDSEFEGAFVCWLLEHVKEPVEILREIHRVLKANGIIYCNEVLNATFYVNPYSPATLKYWFAFNDHQWSLGGDPFVGGKLANYLLLAGFQNIQTEVVTHHYDNRTPKRRAEFIEYWTALMLSGAPGLIQAGKVDQMTVDEMTAELARLKDDPDSVIFYSWVQARAQAL